MTEEAGQPGQTLSELVAERMAKRRWSSHDVARNGGPSARTVQNILKGQAKTLPREATLEALARGLKIPLVRVQKAALNSINYATVEFTPTSDISLVVAAMQALPPTKQAQLAEVILQMVEVMQDE